MIPRSRKGVENIMACKTVNEMERVERKVNQRVFSESTVLGDSKSKTAGETDDQISRFI